MRFGRYLLLKRTGYDAIGEHFLTLWGADEGIDQLRFVRAIYPAVAEDTGFVAEFSEEARALSQLASSNAVRVLEVGMESGIPFVAQEHVEGGALDRLLQLAGDKDRSCTWELAAHIVAEVLRGLDYIHRREDIRGLPLGMRHGDVRPQNILISFAGEVKLTNFNSALYSLVNQATNARFQTERGIFAPPEASDGNAVATVAGDLWGASVLLLSMVAGPDAIDDLQDEDDSLPSIAYRIENLPRRLNLLLARALHPQPEYRFENAHTMREMLLEIIRESAVGHPPDDLAAWATTLGAADRKEEERFVRKMIRQDVRMNLDESAESGKICPGAVLDGKYHLLRVLGEGGMGQVFEAEHLGIEKRVAVKVLHERVLNDQVAVERFKREAKVMGRLRHPNIVEVSDYGETAEGNYFLVMELLTGDTLAARIAKETPVPAEEIIPVMVAVCNGLHAAHDAGVVHRDLKPENIFLTDTGPKIVDFGIAKRADLEQEESSLTRTGNICGTVEYISPEQLRGAEIDHRVDIYTAGLIIYECLTGHTPFRGRNVAETMHRVMTDKVVPPRKRTGDMSIPLGLENLCLKAMSREADRRYQNATEMRLALENLSVSPRRTDTIPPMIANSIRNHSKLFFGAGVVTAALVAAVLLFSPLGDDSGDEEPPGATLTAGLPPSNGRNAEAPEPQLAAPGGPELPERGNPDSPPRKQGQGPSLTSTRLTESPPEPDIVEIDTPDGETGVTSSAQNQAAAELDELLDLGERAFQKMDTDRAAALFKRATELDPASSRAWFGRGKTAFEQGQTETATQWIQKALKLNPGKPTWRIFLGKVYMAAGARDRAIKEWRRVVKIYPRKQEAWRLLEEAGEPVE